MLPATLASLTALECYTLLHPIVPPSQSTIPVLVSPTSISTRICHSVSSTAPHSAEVWASTSIPKPVSANPDILGLSRHPPSHANLTVLQSPTVMELFPPITSIASAIQDSSGMSTLPNAAVIVPPTL